MHDRFSLAKIIDISCVASSVAKSITTKLGDLSCDLGEIAKQLDQLEES